MNKKTGKIDPDLAERASQVIEKAFAELTTRVDEFNALEKKFDEQKQEVEERINRGARRTRTNRRAI